jgi:hypothetical protein
VGAFEVLVDLTPTRGAANGKNGGKKDEVEHRRRGNGQQAAEGRNREKIVAATRRPLRRPS